VVAVGAAYQASLLNNDEISSILLDVTPHNLGVLTLADLTDTVVPKNTKVPVQVAKRFHTVRDDQDTVRIVIVQGDGRKIHDNQILGEFFLQHLRPAPRGEVAVDVTFSLSADGLVTVSATNAESGEEQSISVKGVGLDEGELEQMIAAASKRQPEG
jgi:molecular chaperone DnaK